MRRIDKDPTYRELTELIRTDPIGRNRDISDFIGLLRSIEDGFTIFLDGDWGAGKTFFVKQLKMVLEELDPKADRNDELAVAMQESASLAPLLAPCESVASGEEAGAEKDMACIFKPIYYNAWENDHWDDPLPSIIQEIAWNSLGDGKVEGSTNAERIAGFLDGILKPFNLNVLSEIGRSISGEDLLKDYGNRLEIRNKVKGLIREALQDEDEKMVLIIDELDRCRPTFALRLLEQVKTLFANDDLIVLYSLNTKELSKTIESQYGAGFDGARYLSRFYDGFYSLRVPRSRAYLAYSGTPDDSWRSHEIAHEMVEALGMSLRDQNRYQQDLKRIESFNKSRESLSAASFAEVALSTLLLALKCCRAEDYLAFTELRDTEKLFDYASMSEGVLAYLDAVISERQRAIIDVIPDASGLFSFEDPRDIFEDATEDESVRKQARKAILDASLVLIFTNDNCSERYRNAYKLLMDGSFYGRDLTYIAHQILR